ncbi:hypothetical protein ACFV6F_28590 [Kitasatospora phosalacinea]|uniref:hypothetical protein n=1 Tax=Kitasatospora phosalacinea TaxID=2065 RepID=UPI00364D00F8
MSQTAAVQPQAAAAQGTHHYVLTLQTLGGRRIFTLSGLVTPRVGGSRWEIYQELVAVAARQEPELANPIVLFYDIQPNQL